MADSASPATILDVAKLAKVSPSTVSHALNGKRPVGTAARERIFSAIETLGYTPSYSASHLRKGNSEIIGCYTVDITETFSHKIVKGIERGLAGSGLSMLFVSGVEFGNDFSRAYRFLLSRGIDGLLLCNHIPTVLDTFTVTKNSNIPVIAVNMKLDDLPSVFPDNFNGGMIAADHLYASGMRRPGMICGPEYRHSVEQRLRGFQGRVMELGLEFASDHYIFGEYAYEQGYEAAARLMKTDPRIDGIFCANDYIAAGAINRLTELGYKIPRDIRIIGFDDRDFARFWPVPISTFEQPLEEMGFIGMSALRCAIFSPVSPNEPQILQAKLIPRTSTLGAVFEKYNTNKEGL
ncbi:MAG: LacI family transcriptional regulator [Treponema sp.]|jgi:LacI family transcriptional regulator|nr:LacI family transcriptional regulator [Treponema sp.]